MKIALALILFSLITSMSYAQQTIGMTAGYTRSSITILEDIEEGLSIDSKDGFSIGGYIEMPLDEDKWSTVMGVGYTRKGATLKIEFEDEIGEIFSEIFSEAFETGFVFDYIEVSVMPKFFMDLGNKEGMNTRPYIMAGPVASFLVKCSANVLGISADCKEQVDTDDRMDLGAAIGIGVNQEISDTTTIMAEIIYNLSIKETTLEEAEGFKNRSLMFRIGVGSAI